MFDLLTKSVKLGKRSPTTRTTLVSQSQHQHQLSSHLVTALVPVQAIPLPTVQAMAGQLVLPKMKMATLSSLANKVQIYFLHIKLNFISQQPCVRVGLVLRVLFAQITSSNMCLILTLIQLLNGKLTIHGPAYRFELFVRRFSFCAGLEGHHRTGQSVARRQT